MISPSGTTQEDLTKHLDLIAKLEQQCDSLNQRTREIFDRIPRISGTVSVPAEEIRFLSETMRKKEQSLAQSVQRLQEMQEIFKKKVKDLLEQTSRKDGTLLSDWASQIEIETAFYSKHVKQGCRLIDLQYTEAVSSCRTSYLKIRDIAPAILDCEKATRSLEDSIERLRSIRVEICQILYCLSTTRTKLGELSARHEIEKGYFAKLDQLEKKLADLLKSTYQDFSEEKNVYEVHAFAKVISDCLQKSYFLLDEIKRGIS